MYDWFTPTRAWSLKLTQFPSQTNTPGERDFAHFLRAQLLEWPYFQEHPQQIQVLQTQRDAFERYAVAALVRGEGPQTVILTGHYDVVSVENYGDLGPWAYDPEALLPRLIERLQSEAARPQGLSAADALALEDLLSGNFLPGRGLLDMKSGLAAGLAVMERFARLPLEQRRGNLLFVAVPDEEIASYGARAMAAHLPGLAQQWGLSLEAAVNLDASDDLGDGSQGQAAYLGSVGKLLPAVFLVGRETHAGSPFSGVNVNRLGAEVVRRVECNPLFMDEWRGSFTVPPTCLKYADAKMHYDVTTPSSAWCYFNWLTLKRPVSEVLTRVVAAVGDALAEAIQELGQAAKAYAERTGSTGFSEMPKPAVYTFEELKTLAEMNGGREFSARYDRLQQELSADPNLNTPQVSLRLMEEAWAASGQTGPAAVVGFAAIHYPPVILDEGDERARRLQRAIETHGTAVSRDFQTPFTTHAFFPGISDLSFLGGQVSEEEQFELMLNTPAWGQRAGFDYSAAAGLALPVVNIGPWGRDYHQRNERLYTPYAFEVLPELLWRICADLNGCAAEAQSE